MNSKTSGGSKTELTGNAGPNIVHISANATVINILLSIIVFFLMGFVVMTSYNYSIPVMNENYKPIDYQTALYFTILLTAIGFYVKSDAGHAYKHHIM